MASESTESWTFSVNKRMFIFNNYFFKAIHTPFSSVLQNDLCPSQNDNINETLSAIIYILQYKELLNEIAH